VSSNSHSDAFLYEEEVDVKGPLGAGARRKEIRIESRTKDRALALSSNSSVYNIFLTHPHRLRMKNPGEKSKIRGERTDVE
jgi:hypothetical protein